MLSWSLGDRARVIVSRRWVGLALEMPMEEHLPGGSRAAWVPAQLDKRYLISAIITDSVPAERR